MAAARDDPRRRWAPSTDDGVGHRPRPRDRRGSPPTRGWPAPCSTAPRWSAPGARPRSWPCSPRTCARPAATWSPHCARSAAVARRGRLGRVGEAAAGPRSRRSGDRARAVGRRRRGRAGRRAGPPRPDRPAPAGRHGVPDDLGHRRGRCPPGSGARRAALAGGRRRGPPAGRPRRDGPVGRAPRPRTWPSRRRPRCGTRPRRWRGPTAGWSPAGSFALGAIELTSAPLADPPPALVAAAVREGLRREGLALLPLDRGRHGAALPDGLPAPGARRAVARRVRRRADRGDRDLARARAGADPRHPRPAPDRRARRPAPAAALARGRPARRARARAGAGAERLAACGSTTTATSRCSPYGIQEVFGWAATPRARRRPGAAAAAPALARPPAGRGHRRPGVVLGHRLPAGPRRAARPLPEARLARRPDHGAADTGRTAATA